MGFGIRTAWIQILTLLFAASVSSQNPHGKGPQHKIMGEGGSKGGGFGWGGREW